MRKGISTGTLLGVTIDFFGTISETFAIFRELNNQNR